MIYSICGVTDVIDGILARYWHVESELGSRLDSISDLLFYSAMVIKVIPYLIENRVHYAVWLLAGLAIFFRLCTYILVAIKYHCFSSVHTYANKMTGLVVFLLPFFLCFGDLSIVSLFPGIIGILSSLEEFTIHLTSSSYIPNKKSIFFH